MDRKIIFLGTGTSHGVPVINCNCKTCRSDDIRDNRLRSSLLYNQDNKSILIDCGPDFRQQYMKYGERKRLDAVLLTHMHYDHTSGLDDLRILTYDNGLDVFASDDLIEVLKKRSPYLFHHGYIGTPNLRFHAVMPYLVFNIAGIDIEPFTILHGQLPILGFKIGDFAYITDASMIPDESMKLLKGIDTLVINALRWTEHFAHMNITQALDVITMTGVREAYLTHLSHEAGLYSELSQKMPDNVHVAYDGLSVKLKD